MDAKERTKMGYDLFNKGDMETFFKEMVDENTTWTFPGKKVYTLYQEFTKDLKR